MKIKKTRKKAYHLGNGLNGDGADSHGTYKVLDSAGEEIGFAARGGAGWLAYVGNPLRQYGEHPSRTLAELKLYISR